MAHEAYLASREDGQSLGIVQACEGLSTKTYPIASYLILDLMGAMDAHESSENRAC